MADDENRPVRTYKIPKIETYEVSDDELERIEESCSSVSQDLTVAAASLSIFITLLVAFLTATFINQAIRTFCLVSMVASAFVGIFTGVRWYRDKTAARVIIAKIRSRKVDPQPSSGG